jgi:trimethylamine---corrinoid protein Co-methyltransferase
MLSASDNPFTQSPFRVLAADQAQVIHSASQEAGARVEGKRVYIPPDLVENAFKSLQPVRLFDRTGKPTSLLNPGHVAFSSISDTFYVLDPYQRAARPFLRSDQKWLASVLDAMPELEYVQVVGQAHDVPDSLQTQVAYVETVQLTTKPILIYPYDRAGLLDVLDILAVIAGSLEDFRIKPFLVCASVPAAPLNGSVYGLELLLTCAEQEIPVLHYACPAIGGNSPASIQGTLVQTNADWLANLTIHQLKKPGAPFATAGFTVQLMDMKTTLWSYCAPETLQAYSAVADLAHWYGLPAWGLEMTSDIPQINAQMGVELMAQCQRAFLSQVEMVHNAGIIGAGKLCAAEAVILANEIISYTRSSMEELKLAPDIIAENIEIIDQVGPKGEHISHQYTLEHFRDFWYPDLFARDRFDPTKELHGPDLAQRLNSRARQIIENHQPTPLPVGVTAEIGAIQDRWYARINQ